MFISTFLIGLLSFRFLPKQLPIHFNALGEPDNFAGRWFIFIAPAIILLFIFLAEILRKVDPKSNNYEKFESSYYGIHFAMSLLMLFIQIYTIAYVSGWQINISLLTPSMVGLLFIFLGNILPKFKHNYFVGIRSSWTLASEKVWYATHRFAGKVFVIGGLFLILASFVFPNHLTLVLFLAILFLVLLPVLGSYYYYQKYKINK